MARQKNKPPRADGRYEIKGVYIDEGKPLRKSFYSYVSKVDCERQYQDYLAEIRASSHTDDYILHRADKAPLYP